MCFGACLKDQPRDPRPQNLPCFAILLLCLHRPRSPYFLGGQLVI